MHKTAIKSIGNAVFEIFRGATVQFVAKNNVGFCLQFTIHRTKRKRWFRFESMESNKVSDTSFLLAVTFIFSRVEFFLIENSWLYILLSATTEKYFNRDILCETERCIWITNSVHTMKLKLSCWNWQHSEFIMRSCSVLPDWFLIAKKLTDFHFKSPQISCLKEQQAIIVAILDDFGRIWKLKSGSTELKP